MSRIDEQQFDIWFPTIVGGLVVACLWAIIKLSVSKLSRYIGRESEELSVHQPIDLPSLSALQESKLQEQTATLSALFPALFFKQTAELSEVLRTLPRGDLSMAETLPETLLLNSSVTHSQPCEKSPYSPLLLQSGTVTNDIDMKAPEARINMPECTSPPNPSTVIVTAYLPDNTPVVIVRRVKLLLGKYARGRVKRLKSSIIFQASLPIDPCVFAKLGKLAKDCMDVESRCTLQLGDWAIFYHNGFDAAGKVHLGMLSEGDVPVNVEARWQEGKTGITMCGLYLNGAQIKAATKSTSTTLRSAGPPAQGPGHLDELYLPTEGLYVEESLVYAAKVVEIDGFSLVVRSEASHIAPPRHTSSLTDLMRNWLQKISLSAKKIKPLLKPEDCHPEATHREQHLGTNTVLDVEGELSDKVQLLVEYWKGSLQIEMLDCRKEILYYLEQKSADAWAVDSRTLTLVNSRNQDYLEYWQRGLQELNEVIQWNTHSRHYTTQISIRGGINFLLGNFEKAIQDYDLANLNTGGQPSTVFGRALANFMLAKYPEALQDIRTSVSISPNLNDIGKFQEYLQKILKQEFRQIQQLMFSEQHKTVQKIPDLLTGDEWCASIDKSVSKCTTTADPSVHVSSVKSRETNSKEGKEDTEQSKAFLKWLGEDEEDIKTEVIFSTVHREALEEWNRKMRKVSNHKNEIYNLVGFFSVFQGVLLTSVSQITSLHCNRVWIPALLSLVATFFTTFGLLLRFKYLEQLEDGMSSVKSLLRAHHDIIEGKRPGKDFKFRRLQISKKTLRRLIAAASVVCLFLFSALFMLSFEVTLCAPGNGGRGEPLLALPLAALKWHDSAACQRPRGADCNKHSF